MTRNVQLMIGGGAALIVLLLALTYCSPYQTCVRAHAERFGDPVNAKLYCSRAR